MKPSRNWVWRAIPGWLTETEADYLYQVASELSPGASIVEVGSYLGRSACAIGLGCRESGARLITIDHFEGNPEHSEKPTVEGLRWNLAKIGVLDWVSIVAEEATVAARGIKEPIAMLFVDDAHDFNSVLRTSTAFLPKLTRGGCVLWHDCLAEGWPEVGQAVDKITTAYSLEHVADVGSIAHWRMG